MSTSVTKLFGLAGDNWMRHANPVSVWTDRAKDGLPAQFRSRVLSATYACQVAKAWFIDRMVLLFEDMKARDPEYAGWEH
jgi:hypothetical protein